MTKSNFFTIATFLLTVSFAFAEGNAIPIPLPNDVFVVENDQSVQKTERVVTIEHRPTSSMYVVRGRVRYSDVEGTAYLEMWNGMPDGSRYFSRTLAEHGTMRNIQGSSDWREFELPFNLMELKPESVTLEINVVMPGKGTIELKEFRVSDLPVIATGEVSNLLTPATKEWFDGRTAGMVGGILGSAIGLFGALIGCLCGAYLIPRGKGRRLTAGLLWFGIILGVLLLVTGLTALCLGQPYHVWCPFISPGILMLILNPVFLAWLPHIYAQVELRKIQALDA
jgi:hypothetical protein